MWGWIMAGTATGRGMLGGIALGVVPEHAWACKAAWKGVQDNDKSWEMWGQFMDEIQARWTRSSCSADA